MEASEKSVPVAGRTFKRLVMENGVMRMVTIREPRQTAYTTGINATADIIEDGITCVLFNAGARDTAESNTTVGLTKDCRIPDPLYIVDHTAFKAKTQEIEQRTWTPARAQELDSHYSTIDLGTVIGTATNIRREGPHLLGDVTLSERGKALVKSSSHAAFVMRARATNGKVDDLPVARVTSIVAVNICPCFDLEADNVVCDNAE